MFLGLDILVALTALAAVAFGAVRAARARVVMDVAGSEHAAIVAIARTTRVWRAVGLAAGLVGAGWLASLGAGGLGRWMLLAPMALGIGALAGTAIGELTARSPRGLTRSATLRPRTIAATVPRASWAQAGRGLGLVTVVLSIGGALGGPDDLGRAGRALTRVCVQGAADGSGRVTSSRGPWPGSYYAVPAALALGAVVLLALLALALIVRRQRPSAEDAALDDQLRRWSAMSVLRACSATFLLTAAPLALAQGLMLTSFGNCRAWFDLPLGFSLLALGVLSLLAGWQALGSLVLGPRIVVRDRPQQAPPSPVAAPLP